MSITGRALENPGMPRNQINVPKIPENVKLAIKENSDRIRARWRKVVTGDPSKRVRDHLREQQEVPKYVKLSDKIAFTLGILNMGACQYFLMNRPDLFWLWYAIITPVLMCSRFFHYKQLRFHYFLLDFCYFTVANTLINLAFINYSASYFKAIFIMACGPLPIAILVWRNSLIFHEYDKIISVYIHILPCMLYYSLRWYNPSFSSNTQSDVCTEATCEPLFIYDYIHALGFYVFWQICYFIKTEVLDKSKLDSNPDLSTSLRYMSKDSKNPLARQVLKYLRVVGLYGKNEYFDSNNFKTKAVFMASQLLLTIFCILPTPLFYYNQGIHFLYIVFIYTVAVFNGASFYIEVFSKRYNSKLDVLEEKRKALLQRRPSFAATALDGSIELTGKPSLTPPRSRRPSNAASKPIESARSVDKNQSSSSLPVLKEEDKTVAAAAMTLAALADDQGTTETGDFSDEEDDQDNFFKFDNFEDLDDSMEMYID